MKENEKKSYCSLYCGTCGVFQATQQNDEKLLKLMVRVYQKAFQDSQNLTISSIKCDGCLSERVSVLCQSCSIKKCAVNRNIEGCHQCPEFPCGHIDSFPISSGKSEILKSAKFRAKFGTQKWIEDVLSRYKCSNCNHLLYRGGPRCQKCKTKAKL